MHEHTHMARIHVCAYVGGVNSLTVLACRATCKVGSVRKRKPSGKAMHVLGSGSQTLCAEEVRVKGYVQGEDRLF